jgi:hypothetical protein
MPAMTESVSAIAANYATATTRSCLVFGSRSILPVLPASWILLSSLRAGSSRHSRPHGAPEHRSQPVRVKRIVAMAIIYVLSASE